MVLRKMLDKFRSRSETKKVSEEPEKIDSSKQQKQDGGHGGGETKKKLKKVRSVRVADFDGIRKAPKKTSQNPLNKSLQQATDEVPNYMKSTSSYDARKEKSKVAIDSSTTVTATSKSLSSAARVLVKNSSLKLLRSSMKKNKGKNKQSSIYKTKATCSSPIQDSETPDSVDLKEPLKICPYAYCSLHGHKHGAVPSLKRLLSARRQSLKIQKSMKLRGYSSIKKSGDKEAELVENVVNELFIEIHSKLQEWGEESCYDAEKIYIFDGMSKMKLEGPNDESQLQESCSVTSFEDCGEKNSELSMEDIQVITQFLKFIEQECDEEAQSETEKSEKAATVDNLQEEEYNSSGNEHLQSVEEDWTELEAGCLQRQKGINKANLKSFVVENNVKDCSSPGNRSKVKRSKLRRQPSKFRESVKEINRRPPRLLELQAEPEKEQVNLKHQTVDERKTAEEWMIDNALSKALRRLASTRKKKVPLLVAAFEAVMPQMCETLMCQNAAGNLGQKQDQ